MKAILSTASTVVGDFNIAPSPLEVAFTQLDPEESTSYELGFKASALDRRLQMNLALYHQEYENNPWRSPQPVYFINTSIPAGTTVPLQSVACSPTMAILRTTPRIPSTTSIAMLC
jgi:hypothetical protein